MIELWCLGCKRRAFPMIALLALLVYSSAHAASPSFDCAKAGSAAETLVCDDEQLAVLDRETARLFKLARDGPHMTAERRKELIAYQRGWIKGRDDCWKADDLHDCVLGNYVIRISELRQGYFDARGEDARGISSGPLEVRCDGLDAPIGLTFVKVDPPVAYLEWLDRFLVLTRTPTGSGSRYAAADALGEFAFWIKGDEARFDQPGEDALACSITEPG